MTNTTTSTTRAGESPRRILHTACTCWLREIQDPQVAAILLDQGPHVLGRPNEPSDVNVAPRR